MAAGSAFTLVPASVETLEPEYHNIITQSESMKKDYQNLSAIPVERYRLKLNLSATDRDTFINHVKDQSGGYYLFSWQSVPSHIGGGANISGRWLDTTMSMKIIGGLHWRCEIVFEKDN